MLILMSVNDPVPFGTRPDTETLARVRAHLRQCGIDKPSLEQIKAAVAEVFAARPQLGDSFKFMPDHLEDYAT